MSADAVLEFMSGLLKCSYPPTEAVASDLKRLEGSSESRHSLSLLVTDMAGLLFEISEPSAADLGKSGRNDRS